MGNKFLQFVLLLAITVAFTGQQADAQPKRTFKAMTPPLRFLDMPLVNTPVRLTTPPTVTLAGSTVATIGNRIVVIDEDSGDLVLTDQHGAKLASLAIQPGVGLLAIDRNRRLVFVADRRNDRLWKIQIGTDSLTQLGRVPTPAEPYGLALTPDGITLLVTTIADRKLVAFDTASMKQRYSLEIPREARGIAINYQGTEATIAHLNTGALTHLNLLTKKFSYTTLDPGSSIKKKPFNDRKDSPQISTDRSLLSKGATNRHTTAGVAFARNVFATTYLPNGVNVVAFTESTPHQVSRGSERMSSYGGGVTPPIVHQVAFIGTANLDAAHPGVRRRAPRLRRVVRAQILEHSPRAITYNPITDTLYLGMIGNDRIVAIANASSPSARHKWTQSIKGVNGVRCGISGLAVTGKRVHVHCGFSRTIASLKDSVEQTNPALANRTVIEVESSPPFSKSKLSPEALRGKQLFHMGQNSALSSQGALACASCHPEARNDGLSWRIEGNTLQTPLLIGGRLSGSHPFKWDGKDPTLTTSLKNTVRRLGGSGISWRDVADLKAYFDSLPAPRHPTREATTVARGEVLFRSKTLGCNRCHSGPLYTNQKSYELAEDLDTVDTPSLIGLASSAPYYHDGSAATLRALLLGKGSVHGMGGLDRIKANQLDDLIAFLETL